MNSVSDFRYRPSHESVNTGVQFFDLLLNKDRSGGEDLQMQGDWFGVDPGSMGAVRVQLTAKDTADIQTFLMTPGRVVQCPFSNVRVFHALVSNVIEVANAQGQTQPGSVRILWGKGTPVFIDRSIREGCRKLADPAPGVSAAFLSVTYNVTEGMLLDVYLGAQQATGAAETSFLRPTIQFLNGASPIGQLAPDSLWNIDVAVAGVGVSRMNSAFRQIIVPRTAVTMVLGVFNYGNAVTNNIALLPVTSNALAVYCH